MVCNAQNQVNLIFQEDSFDSDNYDEPEEGNNEVCYTNRDDVFVEQMFCAFILSDLSYMIMILRLRCLYKEGKQLKQNYRALLICLLKHKFM